MELPIFDFDLHHNVVGAYRKENGMNVFVSLGVRFDDNEPLQFFIDYGKLPDYKEMMHGRGRDFQQILRADVEAAAWYRGFRKIKTFEATYYHESTKRNKQGDLQ